MTGFGHIRKSTPTGASVRGHKEISMSRLQSAVPFATASPAGLIDLAANTEKGSAAA